MSIEEQMLDAEFNYLTQVENRCKSEGKDCSNCGQMKLGYGSCIDMTCWRGYVDGSHDGWIKIEKAEKPSYNSYEVSDDDYRQPIKINSDMN